VQLDFLLRSILVSIRLRCKLIRSLPRSMIVCLCHRVSDRDIHREVAAGAQCFDVLQDQTRVASSCGSCHDCAREVFESACARVLAVPNAAEPSGYPA
jgi:bacterioferritin-associated ferredoxin